MRAKAGLPDWVETAMLIAVMKILFLLITLSLTAVHAADIASVNFKAIKEDLREYYLAKPENAEIKAKFQTAVQEEKKQMEEMQKQFMEGRKSIDLKTASKMGGSERYKLERELDGSLKKELYLIVSQLGLKYELIYDASDSESIIFAKSQVDDLTTTLKQAIIDLGHKK